MPSPPALPAPRVVPCPPSTPPPAFPEGIALYQQAYQNWSKEIMLDAIWTCSPKTPEDVVRLANWGHANGYTIRPPRCHARLDAADHRQRCAGRQGHPRRHHGSTLTGVSVNAGGSPATVTAGPGATLDAITTALQAQGLGFANLPAPGVLTIAGCLAVDAHGAALPAEGEAHVPGQTFGSLSNLVTSLTAVVWNGSEYALKTYARSERGDQAAADSPRTHLPHLRHLAGRPPTTACAASATPTSVGRNSSAPAERPDAPSRSSSAKTVAQKQSGTPLHRTPVDEGVVTCTHQAAVLGVR